MGLLRRSNLLHGLDQCLCSLMQAGFQTAKCCARIDVWTQAAGARAAKLPRLASAPELHLNLLCAFNLTSTDFFSFLLILPIGS